ncbi:MAG: hypothetical protein JO363_10700 [Solirubrobacterales bacterium]|nr:hypothetical protein [Solirubrobacterales bacterium]
MDLVTSAGAVEKPQKLQAASFSGEVVGPRGRIAATGDGDVVLTDNDEYGPASGDIYGATLAPGALAFKQGNALFTRPRSTAADAAYL